jgi:N-acetyl-anhydromuramyl-L-alanine amidase AmpD
LHHSGGSGEKDPPTIEEKHMVSVHQWEDVGYHYIIEPNGDIFEGRHLAFKGSHVELANTGKIGILITGDFDPSVWNPNSGKPTPAQMKSAEDLINALKGAFSTITKIGGHKDYKVKTVCPGDELYKLIPGLRTKTSLGGP